MVVTKSKDTMLEKHSVRWKLLITQKTQFFKVDFKVISVSNNFETGHTSFAFLLISENSFSDIPGTVPTSSRATFTISPSLKVTWASVFKLSGVYPASPNKKLNCMV